MTESTYTFRPGDILVRDGVETPYNTETMVPRAFFRHGDTVRHPDGGATLVSDDRHVLYGFRGNALPPGAFAGSGEVGEIRLMPSRDAPT